MAGIDQMDTTGLDKGHTSKNNDKQFEWTIQESKSRKSSHFERKRSSGHLENEKSKKQKSTTVVSDKKNGVAEQMNDIMDPEAIMKRTVHLKIDRGDRLYLREDIMKGLSEVGVQGKWIEALGTLNRNNEWHITFAVNAPVGIVNDLCLIDVIVCNRKVSLTPFLGNMSKVRVHWAPYFLPMAVIEDELEQYGEVKRREFERSITPGLEHVRSLVRGFDIVCAPQDLPAMIKVSFKGRQYPCLLAVKGRPPVCLRCNQPGHMRRDCTTSYCDTCHQFGHETCAKEKTYAALLRPKQDERREEDITEDDARVIVQGQDEPTTASKDKVEEKNAAPANVASNGEEEQKQKQKQDGEEMPGEEKMQQESEAVQKEEVDSKVQKSQVPEQAGERRGRRGRSRGKKDKKKREQDVEVNSDVEDKEVGGNETVKADDSRKMEVSSGRDMFNTSGESNGLQNEDKTESDEEYGQLMREGYNFFSSFQDTNNLVIDERSFKGVGEVQESEGAWD